MKRDDNKIFLVVIFVFLVVLIVGLIIGLTVVNISHRVVDSDDETSHEKLVEGEFDTNYNISRNISEIYYKDNKEKALELFDREMKEALNSGYFERFVYLASSKSNTLIGDGRCEDALSFYDSIDMNGLPADYEANVYIGAIDAATTCENDESKAYFEEKLNALIEEEDLGVEDNIGE